jgi:hypothetical protein
VHSGDTPWNYNRLQMWPITHSQIQYIPLLENLERNFYGSLPFFFLYIFLFIIFLVHFYFISKILLFSFFHFLLFKLAAFCLSLPTLLFHYFIVTFTFINFLLHSLFTLILPLSFHGYSDVVVVFNWFYGISVSGLLWDYCYYGDLFSHLWVVLVVEIWREGWSLRRPPP